MIKKLQYMLLFCLLVFCLSGCNGKQETITLIMAENQVSPHPTALSSDKFAELVKQRTNGRIIIEVYHGEVLGNEDEYTQQVAAGGIDFARVSTPKLVQYDSRLQAFQSLYLYSSEDAMWENLEGSFGDSFLKADNLKENGIEGLCWISGGARNFYNNKKVIESPEDIAGLTLRVNTTAMFGFLEKCGAKGVNVSYGDIYSSIKAGDIDGAENNWPSYISTGHYEVAKYITVDEHTRVPEMIVASVETMNSLSASDQEIIRECAKEAGELQRKWMKEYDEDAIKIAEESGCTITYLTEEQVKKFQDISTSVNEKTNADNIDIINEIKRLQQSK